MFQPDVFYVGGIGHSGLVFDDPVKVIFLEMKVPGQLLDRYGVIMLADILGDLLKDQPVSGFLLL